MSKILIFYAKAGGGHESAAKAISQKILQKDNDIEVEIYDILQDQSLFIQNSFNKGYVLLTEKLPWLWSIITVFWKLWLIQFIMKIFLYILTHGAIEKKILQFEPDIILSSYYFATTLGNRAIGTILNPIKTFTIVTDLFDAHNIWFWDKKCDYIVFSDRVKQKAIRHNIPEYKIHQYNYFFNSKFNIIPTSTTKVEYKRQFALNPDVPTTLMLGGGSSFPNGEKILKELLQRKNTMQIIIICGRNKKLQNRCVTLVQEFNRGKHFVRIFGYTNQVYELISVADLIVAKAGPAAILESLSQRKPIIVSHYIWEQEKPNMEFVVRTGSGFYLTEPKEIADKAEEILYNKTKYAQIQDNINKLKIDSDIEKVCNLLVNEVNKNRPYYQIKGK